MNISLTPELAKMVQAKVASGLYNNASEFIREAIRQHDTNAQLLYDIKLAHLRNLLAEGMNQAETGKTETLTLNDILQELNA